MNYYYYYNYFGKLWLLLMPEDVVCVFLSTAKLIVQFKKVQVTFSSYTRQHTL